MLQVVSNDANGKCEKEMTKMSANYMPAIRDTKTVVGNLKQARSDVGSGGGTGETYLKIDDRGGALTFGQEQNPLPPGGRFVVGLHAFAHGYIDMRDGQVSERRVVPMAQQSARPVPPNGYGTYEQGGPRDVTEIQLNSIEEPGFNLVYTAWGVSSANRIRNLLDAAIVHCESPDGEAGFVHPVIIPKSGKYYSKKFKRDVWHFDFDVVDWLHNDGATLLSSHGPVRSIEDAKGGPAPWDDPDEDDDEMSAEERELLKA